MEVNANPSLNVYNDKELPNGDIEQTLSELDKYVKTTMLGDTLNILTNPVAAERVGWYRRILPVVGESLDHLYLYSTAEQIFEILAGSKSFDYITAN